MQKACPAEKRIKTENLNEASEGVGALRVLLSFVGGSFVSDAFFRFFRTAVV